MSRYLVPILRTKKASPTLEQFWIFMERNGSHLIALEGEGQDTEAAAIVAARDFCETNELSILAEPFCSGPFVFVPIDPSDKDLAGFYSWEETPPGTTPLREVWRPFLWVHMPNAVDPWGVNKMLDTIQVAETPAASVYSVIQNFLAAGSSASS